MCGIIGFLGMGGAISQTLDGLQELEYRGYDSAGLSYIDGDEIKTVKAVGNVSSLRQIAPEFEGKVAIGHTRWATHGGVTVENSHPHVSWDNRVSVVHNGIIENYRQIIDEFNFTMKSQTDTEVIPNLVSLYLDGSLLDAVKKASSHLRGSYAFLSMSVTEPGTLVAARRGRQPLVIGKGRGFIYVSSDLPTAKQKCNEIYTLDDGEFCLIKQGEIIFETKKQPLDFDIESALVTKGDFDTFMEKEIFEVPEVVSRILKKYETIDLGEIRQKLRCAGTVHIAACGTAYHSGLVLAQLVEQSLKVRVRTYIASELPYQSAILKSGDVGVVISQSGETADTISAMQLFRENGLDVIAICNVEGSSIARYCDFLLPTFAGAEIAVASTKAFVAQVLVSAILTEQVPKEFDFATLDKSNEIKQLAKKYEGIKKMFFLGKGLDSILALECALKVKEITYKHCEGFPSGELKHGTLALVDDETLTVMLCTSKDEKLIAKLDNARHEVVARGSHIIDVASKDFITGAIWAQLFSLYLAKELGLNPDQPRNLAKSVTVE